MANQKAPPKPTIKELLNRGDIPPHVVQEIEDISIRLIQIQDTMKSLNDERGFTDPGGKRHRGISDRLEELFIMFSLPGVAIEDFISYQTHGSSSRVNPTKLLERGVMPDVIKESTDTSHWTGVAVRRIVQGQSDE